MRRTLFALALASAAVLAAPSMAAAQAGQPTPPAAHLAASPDASLTPADAPAGVYNIDPRHASVVWRIRHLGLSLFTARFDTIAGSLTFDPLHPENSSVSVTIAANSVDTGVLDAHGQRTFDADIANNVLGAAAAPNITFVSRSVTITGPTTGLITGDLTLHGVTKSMVLEANFEGGRFVSLEQSHGLGFTGRTIIHRSDFGAVFSNSLFNGAVGDDVEVFVSADFLKPVTHPQTNPSGHR